MSLTRISLCLVLILFDRTLAQNCKIFNEFFKNADELVSIQYGYEAFLQSIGYVLHEKDLGFARRENLPHQPADRLNDVFITTARLMKDESQDYVDNFGQFSQCLGGNVQQRSAEVRPMYRPIDNYGNNLKNPYWGTPGTPFFRMANRSYDDSIRSVRKSVTGKDLPSPRKIMIDVLDKAEKKKSTQLLPNALLITFIFYNNHDMSEGGTADAHNTTKVIRCCKSLNTGTLPPNLLHHDCIPIEVGKDDPFYGNYSIRCLPLVRGQFGTYPAQVQIGEVRNNQGAYMDHSVIYGYDELFTSKVRTFSGGKLRLSDNTLPMDENGRYIRSSDRFWKVIAVGMIWPVLFSRFHNYLAEGLQKVNSRWSDDKLFEEARRINIAWLQNFVYNDGMLKKAFNLDIKEDYDENINPATGIEFNTAAFRFIHYYCPSEVELRNEKNVLTKIKMSDAMGKIHMAKEDFEGLLRGVMNQSTNTGEFSKEILNKSFKYKRPFGLDLYSMDIQRGRDHGLPPYLEMRRKCNLKTLRTFEDLKTIFPASYVDLLRKVYDSPKDIDLYVGGGLESIVNEDGIYLGETFRCLVADHYKRVMAGDAYYFTHDSNPYQFTKAQLKSIKEFTQSHLICAVTKVSSVQKNAFYMQTEDNPRVSCTEFKPFDFSTFKDKSESSRSRQSVTTDWNFYHNAEFLG